MGSNGVNGRDECSENWSLTFAACNMASAADSNLDTVANAIDNFAERFETPAKRTPISIPWATPVITARW